MLPAIWIASLPGFKLDHIWYLSVASVAMQAIISFVLLHRVMRAKLA